MAQKTQILFDLHAHGINPQTRDIYLHSHYNEDSEGGEPGVEYRESTTLIKNLQFLDQPPGKHILIHLHSAGGSWEDGMAMFNAVQFCQSPLTMLAYAQASSMSGIILQSAPTRIMMPDCHFMMHHGTAAIGAVHPYGYKNDADLQIKNCKRMLQIFAERAILGAYFKKKKSSTVDTAYNFFDKKLKEQVDWYLSAEETVFYGLADDILGSSDYPTVQALKG